MGVPLLRKKYFEKETYDVTINLPPNDLRISRIELEHPPVGHTCSKYKSGRMNEPARAPV